MRLNLQALYKKPYAPVPFSIPYPQVEKAIAAFFEFLNLSMDKKEHMYLKISPSHRRGELGFVHRNADDHIYNDSKDFFHYHPMLEKHYPEFIDHHPAIKHFLDQARPLWKAVYEVIKAILSDFETVYPDTLDKVFKTDTPHIILRFLRYDYQKAGLYLAKPHFDSGAFTLAIAESSPGLRMGTSPEDLALVEHKEGEAIFMISSNARKIIDENGLKPVWHDVIQVDESKRDKSFSRWAIVAFIDGHSVDSLARHETHKFYQDKAQSILF